MCERYPNSTYDNPKRAAYHETGHLLALYLLTGGIEGPEPVRTVAPSWDSHLPFQSPEQHRQVFNLVCFYVAGGVGEWVYSHLRGLPKAAMVDDIDQLHTIAKHEWRFPFKQKRNGFQGCPVLDNLIKSAVDMMEALFRQCNTILKARAVSEYLIKYSLDSPGALHELQENTDRAKKLKKGLMTILTKKGQYETTGNRNRIQERPDNGGRVRSHEGATRRGAA